MTNSKQEYNDFVRANLPGSIRYDSVRNRYVTANNKYFVTYKEAKWYVDYLVKRGSNLAYAEGGYTPSTILDYSGQKSYVGGNLTSSFDDVVTATRTGLATQLDASGNLVWNAHNLLLRSEEFDNTQWSKTSATVTANSATAPDGTATADIVSFSATTSRVFNRVDAVFKAGDKVTLAVWVRSDTLTSVPLGINGRTQAANNLASVVKTVSSTITKITQEFTVAADDTGLFFLLGYNGFGTPQSVDVGDLEVWGAHLYRSDLGGMAPVPLTRRVAGSTTYVPTTSAAVYLPREEAYTYVSGSLVGPYYQKESDARTNLLHTTNALVTQTLTVTAVPHTLHFTGTGTVTLSGVSTAGPLVGTGTGENNRVSLTFTPTAGSLTLTVSGTVSDAQLEVGSTLSSYIPNLAASGTVTRPADSTTIAAGNMPYPTPQVIGPELVTNGTFDTDTSGWVTTASASISAVDGELEIVKSGGVGEGAIFALSGLTAGKTYLVTAQLRGVAGSRVELTVLNNILTTFLLRTTPVTNTSLTEVTGIWTAEGPSDNIYLRMTADGTAYADNISVREINPLALSFQMEGLVTMAESGGSPFLLIWEENSNNFISWQIRDALRRISFTQRESAVSDAIFSATNSLPEYGINVPFNIASRHGSTFINGAVDGTALTADTTPTALPDLSATTFDLAPTFNGFIKEFRVWADDIGDTGIAEAST